MEAPDTRDESKIEEWRNIKIGGKTDTGPGIFKMNASGLGWKGKSSKEMVERSLLLSAIWIPLSSNRNRLELQLKGGASMKFDGFKNNDAERLRQSLKENFEVDLTPIKIATTGVNHGEVVFDGSNMTFMIGNNRAFQIPLNDVSRAVHHTAAGSKNDVSLDFHQDDTSGGKVESLIEIRFHCPPGNPASTAGSDDENAEEIKTPAQQFYQNILAKADVLATSGKAITTLSQLPVLTPRGRYTVEMFSSFMRLHGSTYDYKILYTHISRLFQLPKPDQHHVIFVISIDPPIIQGQTRYPHLVLQFSKDDNMEATITIPAEQEEKMAEKYAEFKDKTISGPSHEVVGKIFKILTGKKITFPNSFKSHSGASAVKCNFKNNEGLLFPLEHSFFYVHKPPTHIRFEEISFVEFSRVEAAESNASTKTFDLVLVLKSNVTHQFGIQRHEYSNLFNFISKKNITIRNALGDIEAEPVTKQAVAVPDLDESSSEDEDFAAVEEEDIPEDFDEGSDADEDDVKEVAPPKDKKEKKEKREKKEKKDKKERKEKKEKKEKPVQVEIQAEPAKEAVKTETEEKKEEAPKEVPKTEEKKDDQAEKKSKKSKKENKEASNSDTSEESKE
eukprot:TRINITY_DN230_c0_g3_i1.p1 TRINITY_DN230_c0_g3~~TRINITY_DN230_c0_g3_i1.p1  ORF type:complete len:617 (-),score=253.70 TRINITY_DN230_c0_g3_i1:128-1978(-)